MKQTKRLFAVLLAVVMLLSAVPVMNMGITASAVDGVETKLAVIKAVYPAGSFFTTDGESDSSDKDSRNQLSNIPARGGLSSGSDAALVMGDAWSCCAFARYVFYNIFGTGSMSKVSLSNAKVGDYVEFDGHYGIYLSHDSSNIYVYDSNFQKPKQNKVGYNSAVPMSRFTSIYHASNYDEISGSTPDLDPVDVAEGVYMIQSVRDPSKVLDVQYDSTEVGANIQLYEKTGTDIQLFRVTKNDSSYSIQSVYSGLWLDTSLPANTAGCNIQLWNDNTNQEQQWQFFDAGDGNVYIRSLYGVFIDTYNGYTSNNTNVETFYYDGSTSQQWTLICNNPRGWLDLCQGGVGCVNIAGWAVDDDDPNAQLNIEAYISDGDSQLSLGNLSANLDRPADVGPHGFSGTLNTNLTGTHTVSVYAVNVGSGNEKALLGTETVTITSAYPKGKLDCAVGGPGSIYVAGWAYDADDPNAAIEVHVYIDGPVGVGTLCQTGIIANQPSPDLFEALGYQGNHRFEKTFSITQTGTHEIYLYAINVGRGENALIDSGTVSITSANPQGRLDCGVGSEGGIYVAGWAYDPNDPDAAIEVRVYIDGPAGVGTCCQTGIIANQPSPDLFEELGYQGNHRFEKTFSTTQTGTHEIYLYAINVGFGENALIGSGSVTITSHTHNYTGNVTKAATCSATGIRTYTCSCGDSYTETIPINSSNHVNTKNVGAVVSTCTVRGYTAGVYCNDCKKYISGHQVLPFVAHTTELRNAREATCTAEGYTGDQYCSTCQQIISTGSTIGMKAHTLTTVSQREATCTAEGYTGDQYCTTCEQIISTGSTIGKKAHTTTIINKKDATYDADGYTGDTYCTTCKQTIAAGTVIPKLEKPTDPTPSNPQPSGGCKWCGQNHGGAFGWLVKLFHNLFAAIFGAKY